MNHSGLTPVFGILYSSLWVISILAFLFSSCSFSCYYLVFRFHRVLRALAMTSRASAQKPSLSPKCLSIEIILSWSVLFIRSALPFCSRLCGVVYSRNEQSECINQKVNNWLEQIRQEKKIDQKMTRMGTKERTVLHCVQNEHQHNGRYKTWF